MARGGVVKKKSSGMGALGGSADLYPPPQGPLAEMIDFWGERKKMLFSVTHFLVFAIFVFWEWLSGYRNTQWLWTDFLSVKKKHQKYVEVGLVSKGVQLGVVGR